MKATHHNAIQGCVMFVECLRSISKQWSRILQLLTFISCFWVTRNQDSSASLRINSKKGLTKDLSTKTNFHRIYTGCYETTKPSHEIPNMKIRNKASWVTMEDVQRLRFGALDCRKCREMASRAWYFQCHQQ